MMRNNGLVKSLVFVYLLLFSTAFVLAVPDVNLSLSSPSSVVQGGSFQATLSILTNETVNFTVSVSDLSGPVVIPASSFVVNPSEGQVSSSQDVSLQLSIGSNTAVGDYSGTVTVSYVTPDGSYSGSEQSSFSFTVLNPSGTLSFSDVSFGGSSQERDEVVTQTFTVTNNGAQPVTNVQFSSTVPSAYSFNITPSSTTVPAGGSITVTASLFIPDDEDAGRRQIGVITASGTSGGSSVSSQAAVFLEVANHLIINDGDISINGRDKDLDDGDDFDVKPGDEIVLTFTLENTYSRSQEIDIEDVEISVENDDLDLDDVEDINTIRYDDTEKVSFKFSIPYDALEDDSPFDIDVFVTGVDENGAEHSDEWTFSLNLDKERDELIFTDFRVEPSVVSCDSSSVVVKAEITNIGSRDQDEGVLQVSVDDFSFEKIIYDIELEEGDSNDFSVTVPLPDNLDEGEYEVRGNVYTSRDSSDLTDVVFSKIVVANCAPKTTTTPSQPSDSGSGDSGSGSGTVVVPPSTGSNAGVVTTVPTVPPSQSVKGTPSAEFVRANSDVYLALLIVLTLLLLVLVIVLAIKAFKN